MVFIRQRFIFFLQKSILLVVYLFLCSPSVSVLKEMCTDCILPSWHGEGCHMLKTWNDTQHDCSHAILEHNISLAPSLLFVMDLMCVLYTTTAQELWRPLSLVTSCNGLIKPLFLYFTCYLMEMYSIASKKLVSVTVSDIFSFLFMLFARKKITNVGGIACNLRRFHIANYLPDHGRPLVVDKGRVHSGMKKKNQKGKNFDLSPCKL